MSARSYTPLEALCTKNVSVIRDPLIERGAGAKPLTGFGVSPNSSHSPLEALLIENVSVIKDPLIEGVQGRSP